MKTRNEILSELRTILHGAKSSCGVKHLSLFGSWATGQETADSDIDLLVEFDISPSFDAYMRLRILLEDRLEHSVDLVTLPALRPELANTIQSEAINVS